MRTSTKLLAAGAAALALSAASAASAGVFISFDGLSALAGGTFADGGYDFVANCANPALCGGFAGIEVSGSTGALPTLLHSATVDATTQAGTAADITVYVTRTDIVSPNYDLFASSFTSNNTPLFGPSTPFTVTLATFVDPTDGLFGGNPLSSFTSGSTGGSASNQLANGLAGNGPYSVTEKYTIHAAAFGDTESTSPSIILAGAGTVPEPASWALLIMGFGGVGALLRSRPRRALAV